ncbi:MAG: hypothetical protein HQM10_20255 [Candidatus Riflebacteria bacterium]|nr:hypothetical protein [Candidatus Riflebacteria bacterium]
MASDIEKILRPVDNPAPDFPAKFMTLSSGEKLVIRQITREEIPMLLPHVEPLLHVDRDYYDIVAARVYAELLGYYRHRVQDEYVLIAQINGELVAIVNGRRLNPEIGMSYHTLSLRRGLRVGAHAFAAKMEYHFDIMNQKEVLIVAESPNGFRRWMIEYQLEKRFNIAHELGGVPSWSLTRQLYEKAKGSLIVGARPVPDELLKKAMDEILPPKDPPRPPKDLFASKRSKCDATMPAGSLSSHCCCEGGKNNA